MCGQQKIITKIENNRKKSEKRGGRENQQQQRESPFFIKNRKINVQKPLVRTSCKFIVRQRRKKYKKKDDKTGNKKQIKKESPMCTQRKREPRKIAEKRSTQSIKIRVYCTKILFFFFLVVFFFAFFLSSFFLLLEQRNHYRHVVRTDTIIRNLLCYALVQQLGCYLLGVLIGPQLIHDE